MHVLPGVRLPVYIWPLNSQFPQREDQVILSPRMNCNAILGHRILSDTRIYEQKNLV